MVWAAFLVILVGNATFFLATDGFLPLVQPVL